MNYTKFDLNSGEIYLTGSCPDQDISFQEEAGFGILLDVTASADSNYVLNGTLLTYTPEQALRKKQRPAFARKWTNETFEWIDERSQEDKVTTAKIQIGYERRKLLEGSDWTQLPDVPLETKQAWATYRQALRDITEQPGYPTNIVWPTRPQ